MIKLKEEKIFNLIYKNLQNSCNVNEEFRETSVNPSRNYMVRSEDFLVIFLK